MRDTKRWRRVFKIIKGFGEWVQLSVFQCRLSPRSQAELITLLDGIIRNDEDHVVLIDIGPAEQIKPRVVSLGKSFAPLERGPIVV